VKKNVLYSYVLGRRWALKSFCSLAVFVWMAFGSAQSLAQLPWSGVLRNAGGAPIADAKITLTSEHAKGEARTDTNGRFTIQVAEGSYRLTVAAKDASASSAQSVDVKANGPEALLTLAGRGELTVGTLAAHKEKAGTGGERAAVE